MSRTFSILMFSLVLILIGAVCFLGLEISHLKEVNHVSINQMDETLISKDALENQIKALQKDLEAQKNALIEFSVKLQSTQDNIKSVANQNVMPAPQYAVPYQIFQTKQNGNQVAAIGAESLLNQWVAQNDLFLEQVMLKSMPLEYDRTSRRVVVQDIVTNSVFYQMGLRRGDGIVTVNGRPINNGSVLRQSLLEPKSKEIVVQRNGKRLQLNVSYDDKAIPARNVELSLSQEQFINRVPELLSQINVEEAQYAGLPVGVKITSVSTDSTVLEQLDVKENDVITKINGKRVSKDELAKALTTKSNGQLKLEILRQNLPTNVSVKFAK